MKTKFSGDDYNPTTDAARLDSQIARIFALMCDGTPRTLNEIAELTESPEASVSAQLRNLRKPKFGGYLVLKRRREPSSGLYEYQVLGRNAQRQLSLLDPC